MQKVAGGGGGAAASLGPSNAESAITFSRRETFCSNGFLFLKQ
ncbi:hypothetical protein N9L76_00795 [bacterium]|nr:hypothetical protein [bacterium]